MDTTLFWCATIALLDKLSLQSQVTRAYVELLDEDIHDKQYVYTVLVNDVRYMYNFTLSSNTKLIGSFFVASDDWTSHIYSIEKTYDFVHVSETAVDFHDLYLLNKRNVIDVYIRSGKKSSISTVAMTAEKKGYVITPTTMVIEKNTNLKDMLAIVQLFAISGAVDKLKTTIRDAVSYSGVNMSLVTYTDVETQFIGVSTKDPSNKTVQLQCINSFYNQRYEISSQNGVDWHIREIVEGIRKTFVKRDYTFHVDGNTILCKDKKFTYEVNDNDVIFRKA